MSFRQKRLVTAGPMGHGPWRASQPSPGAAGSPSAFDQAGFLAIAVGLTLRAKTPSLREYHTVDA
ncbi:hypothetical protein PAAG_00806 [Paracoccidioides lutzii Pb01]|uniref:Uncharacterized protein n=1 Tax=Paracoccidioides lutzii (strain ATCC MYA-826 / Pb01) TaxID=502779 RepID=C1GQL1_PARBA|nr:hypothetical protein PAAG_00806 [Paracoccidioides lutzii Pb01]EEH37885.1 hypothetical protein PAAG_00806 [Paracoccidioides lutzii Pb01]